MNIYDTGFSDLFRRKKPTFYKPDIRWGGVKDEYDLKQAYDDFKHDFQEFGEFGRQALPWAINQDAVDFINTPYKPPKRKYTYNPPGQPARKKPAKGSGKKPKPRNPRKRGKYYKKRPGAKSSWYSKRRKLPTKSMWIVRATKPTNKSFYK